MGRVRSKQQNAYSNSCNNWKCLFMLDFSPNFKRSRVLWDELHERSAADPLFMSWAWQSAWWESFARDEEECQLFWSLEKDEKPVALLPCFTSSSVLKGIWSVNRIQVLGGVVRGSSIMPDAIRSEHLGLIIRTEIDVSRVISGLVEKLIAQPWQEFVIKDLDFELEHNRLLISQFEERGFFIRVSGRNTSYSISLPSNFQDYISELSESTRRHMFNKRRVLHELGDVEIIDLAKQDWGKAIQVLNELHAIRWGKPAYNHRQIGFHSELRKRLGTERVEISCLSVNGRPISVLHNVMAEGVVYNLQSGFDSSIDSRISPMILHLGMAIESAIDSGNTSFSLLAGEGQRTNFKESLATDEHRLIDIQIIRDSLLARAYKMYDGLFGRDTKIRSMECLTSRNVA